MLAQISHDFVKSEIQYLHFVDYLSMNCYLDARPQLIPYTHCSIQMLKPNLNWIYYLVVMWFPFQRDRLNFPDHFSLTNYCNYIKNFL